MENLKFIILLSVIFWCAQLEPAIAARTFNCSEPLPEFTLGPSSNPTRQQIKELCSCIWEKFPEGGWERRTSGEIKASRNPGWRGRAFISRVGKALEDCGGYKL